MILLKLLILHKGPHRTALSSLWYLWYVSKRSCFARLPHIVYFKCLIWCMVLCFLLNLGHRGGDASRPHHARPSVVDGATRHEHLASVGRRHDSGVHISLVLSIEMWPLEFRYQRVAVSRGDLLIIRLIFDWLVLIDAKRGLLVKIFLLRSWIPTAALVEFTMILHFPKDLPFVGLFNILLFSFFRLVHFPEMRNLML